MVLARVDVSWIMVGVLLVLSGCGGCSPSAPGEGTADDDGLAVSGIVDGHSSRDALDWSGRYRGLVPCADCEAIDTTITLNGDGTYARRLQYLGRPGSPFEETGPFEWSAAGDRVVLGAAEAAGDGPQYQVGENVLFQLDRAGERITGALAERYQLPKRVEDPRLEGVAWQLTMLNGETVMSERLPTLLLSRAEESASGDASCNRFTVAYDVLAGGRLLLGPDVAVTRMACPDPTPEQAYLQMLPTVRAYRLAGDGSQLELSDAAGAVRARFQHAP